MADVLRFHRDREHEREGDRHHDREPDPLWREALGRYLRAAREERGGRLVDIAERAGISPQYLSEIERGRKEPSSEMIAAVGGALGVALDDLLIGIAGDVRRRRATSRLPSRLPDRLPGRLSPARRPAGPVLLAA